MFRKTTIVTTLFALTATLAFASVHDDRGPILETAAALQGHRDRAVYGADATGATVIAAVDYGRGPIVYTAGDPVSSGADVLWCTQDAYGRLDDCTSWRAGQTGCIFGVCWCSGDCDGYVDMICPSEWYDSFCADKEGGGELCVCTAK